MKNYALAMDLLYGDYDKPFRITFLGDDEEIYFVGYSQETGLYGNYPDEVEDVMEFMLQVIQINL